MWISGFSEKEKSKPKPNEKTRNTQLGDRTGLHFPCRNMSLSSQHEALPSLPRHPASVTSLLRPLNPLGTFELATPAQTFPGLKTSFFCLPLPQALFGDWLIPSTSESPGAHGKTSQARLHPWPVKSESLGVRPRPRIKKKKPHKTKSQLPRWFQCVCMGSIHKF